MKGARSTTVVLCCTWYLSLCCTVGRRASTAGTAAIDGARAVRGVQAVPSIVGDALVGREPCRRLGGAGRRVGVSGVVGHGLCGRRIYGAVIKKRAAVTPERVADRPQVLNLLF